MLEGASMIALSRYAASLFMTDFGEWSNVGLNARRLSEFRRLARKGRRH
jgi:hypothetical protein